MPQNRLHTSDLPHVQPRQWHATSFWAGEGRKQTFVTPKWSVHILMMIIKNLMVSNPPLVPHERPMIHP